MSKKRFLTVFFLFCIYIHAAALDTFIRINQLGYNCTAQKSAVLLSESGMYISGFTVHDALTDELIATFNSVKSYGIYQKYKSVYILDFSTVRSAGSYYIKAGHVFSPIVHVHNNVVDYVPDKMLNFFRHQRCGYNPVLNSYCHQHDGLTLYSRPQMNTSSDESSAKKSNTQKKEVRNKTIEPQSAEYIDLTGGWHTDIAYVKDGSITSTTVINMLYAYRLHPATFDDKFDENGLPYPNKVPDILDEAKWGTDWILKLCVSDSLILSQVGDDRAVKDLKLPANDTTNYGYGAGAERIVYGFANRVDDEISTIKNQGIANVAARYATALAMGADVFKSFYPDYSRGLESRALKLYSLAKKNSGVSQSKYFYSKNQFKEMDWTDDLQMAAVALYQLTYDGRFKSEAIEYGRLQPVAPWIFADSVTINRWFPLCNLAHFSLLQSEDPKTRNEFLQNIRTALLRAQMRQSETPFGICVPASENRSYYVASLALECCLYRVFTGDTSFVEMENNHFDWLFGRNPKGMSLVVGLPELGNFQHNPTDLIWRYRQIQPVGAVLRDLANEDTDSDANSPDMNASATLFPLLSSRGMAGEKFRNKNIYSKGAVVSADTTRKAILLAFTAHQSSDGAKTILKTLKKHQIAASFFVTGDFLRLSSNKTIINQIQKQKYYIGAYSDKFLKCCEENNQKLLIERWQFEKDLKQNFKELQRFKISKSDASFYMPPMQFYTDSISLWANELGLKVMVQTPGLLYNADNSYPEMRSAYYSSDEILKSIIELDKKQGLNGKIIVVNMGPDARRFDKFYNKLDELILYLKNRGYVFEDVNSL